MLRSRPQAEMAWQMSLLGKFSNKMLTTCCLRGYKAYHLQKSTCGARSYSAKCKSKCNWSAKADRQNSTETAKNHKPQIQAWIPGEKKNTCTQAGSCCSIQFMRISTISHTSNVLAVKYIKRKEKKPAHNSRSTINHTGAPLS